MTLATAGQLTIPDPIVLDTIAARDHARPRAAAARRRWPCTYTRSEGNVRAMMIAREGDRIVLQKRRLVPKVAHLRYCLLKPGTHREILAVDKAGNRTPTRPRSR